ncbi:TetR/AcrR family transcriptional regulator [Nocardia panacis]|uniref:TetR/AcrR family transcriptional regulator n=1 Tax=Nocardia panacis TaxID=2340916 RepID=UPI001315250F|nr:TetR/AcrR family transcriptional regulator [Nocardia panacis]
MAELSRDRSTRSENEVQTWLLDAACELFADRGYAAVGIREIAKRAGVTIGSLYHYADSKESLFVKLVERSYSRFMPRMREQAAAPGTPTERLRGLTRVHIMGEVAERDLWRVSRAELNLLSPTHRARMIALRDEFEAVWAEVIDSGLATGEFTAPDSAVTRLCVIELCNGVGSWFNPEGRLTLDEVITQMAHNALLLLGVDEP